MDTNAYKILMADDCKDDRLFLRMALDRFPQFTIVAEVSDGDEAIDYLAGRGKFSDRQTYPLPDLLLLDLKMPRKTGFQVLEWLRIQSFPHLVVAVLSGSALARDIADAFRLGAHGYWTKSAGVKANSRIVEEVTQLLEQRLHPV